MIRRLKRHKAISLDFVVCDIENRSDGSVISIDTYDGKQHYTHYDWYEWYLWLKDQARENVKFRRVYAHNGGGWDWLSFIEWVLTINPSVQFQTVENGNRIVCVRIHVEPKVTVSLSDSLYLIKGKLDDIGKKLVGRGKVKLEHLPEWYWENDRDKYTQYHHEDTELLYDSIVAFARLVHTHIAPIARLGMTLPSTAMAAFRTRFQPCDILVPQDENLKLTLRRAYMGGRVEVFRPGYFENVRVYDVNSLYPSVMQDTPVPITGTVRKTKEFEPNLCGVYYVRFQQYDTNRSAVLMSGGIGAYEGTGWYFEPELRRLATVGAFDVVEGYVFTDQGVIFKSYVDTLYSLRLTDKTGPIGETCKLFLNSLYGKFGMRPERTKTVRLEYEQIQVLIDRGVQTETINPEIGLYRVYETVDVPYEHVGIAGTITSEARARLWEGLDSASLYCDTDSVHTTTPLDSGMVDPSRLGFWKLEFTGNAVYLGKKLYGLRDGTVDKLRVKGIRVGGENGFPLTFEHLRSLVDGGTLACTFKTGTTAHDVMNKGLPSCRFQTKTRTIRRTV